MQNTYRSNEEDTSNNKISGEIRTCSLEKESRTEVKGAKIIELHALRE
jgi:hypothetical protein